MVVEFGQFEAGLGESFVPSIQESLRGGFSLVGEFYRETFGVDFIFEAIAKE